MSTQPLQSTQTGPTSLLGRTEPRVTISMRSLTRLHRLIRNLGLSGTFVVTSGSLTRSNVLIFRTFRVGPPVGGRIPRGLSPKER